MNVKMIESKTGMLTKQLVALILLLGCLQLTITSVGAYTEKENLAYIERIIGQLNNRYECELPSYNEVDEMQKAFSELEVQHGSNKFETMLSDDMRLVRATLLDQWTSFQQRMSSRVVIRAAKRRSFLCKVEEYQLRRFGDSSCTRFKDVRGPVTDKIFEKNPIVRYIKHLETNEVIERPDEEEQATTIQPWIYPKTVGEEAGEDQSTTTDHTINMTNTTNTIDIMNMTTTTTTTETSSELEELPVTEVPEIHQETTTPVVYKSIGDSLKPGDQYLDEDGVPKIFLGHFTVTKEDESGAKSKLKIKIDQHLEYDSLDEIPVPGPNDGGEEKPMDDIQDPSKASVEEETTTSGQPELSFTETLDESTDDTITTREPSTSTTTEEPLFDELGAAYVDIDDDDDDLARVVRLPKKDWEFDEVFGYFKWPDENNQELADPQYRLDNTVRHMWTDFMADPFAFDQYLDSLTSTTPRPRINGAKARRRKQELFDSMADEERRDAKFGWGFENTPAKLIGTLKMPPEPKDRWVKMLNNNVCKMGYNKDEIKRKAKGGVMAVKSWFNRHRGDGSEPEFPDEEREINRS